MGDKKPIYLCSLLPERLETCALNLEFEEDDEVTFSIIGSHSVHLSGFFYGNNADQDNLGIDYGSYPFTIVAKLIELPIYSGVILFFVFVDSQKNMLVTLSEKKEDALFHFFAIFFNSWSDPYVEDIMGIDSEDEDDSISYDSEDEDDNDDYIDDDLGMYPPSPIPNSGGIFLIECLTLVSYSLETLGQIICFLII